MRVNANRLMVSMPRCFGERCYGFSAENARECNMPVLQLRSLR